LLFPFLYGSDCRHQFACGDVLPTYKINADQQAINHYKRAGPAQVEEEAVTWHKAERERQVANIDHLLVRFE
jgi:hypothetical protein